MLARRRSRPPPHIKCSILKARQVPPLAPLPVQVVPPHVLPAVRDLAGAAAELHGGRHDDESMREETEALRLGALASTLGIRAAERQLVSLISSRSLTGQLLGSLPSRPPPPADEYPPHQPGLGHLATEQPPSEYPPHQPGLGHLATECLPPHTGLIAAGGNVVGAERSQGGQRGTR